MSNKKPAQISIETAMHIASGEFLEVRLPMESFDGIGWDDKQVDSFIADHASEAYEGTTVNDIWRLIERLADVIRQVSIASIGGVYGYE